MLVILKGSNLGVRFLVEMAALWALGYWGFRTGQGTLLRWTLGLGAPLLAAIIWSLWGSPKAPYLLTGYARLIFDAGILGGSVLALYAAGRPGLAGLFGAAMALNELLLLIWKQHPVPPATLP